MPLTRSNSVNGLLGALAYSGANFIISFQLQGSIPAHEFGQYAIALVCIQFGISLSNALFASPIVVSILDPALDHDHLLSSYFRANLLFISLATLLLATSLYLMGMALPLISLVIIQATALWLRWFLRAIELAEQRYTEAAQADLSYGLVTFVLGAGLFLFLGVNEFNALLAMAMGAIVSAITIKQVSLSSLLRTGPPRPSLYPAAFHLYGRWALVGVITTEITTNLHSYVLTVFLGPTAFAPVATLLLFFRPVPILVQISTQYERPKLARAAKEGNVHEIRSNVRRTHTFLTIAVMINASVVAILLTYWPTIIGGGQYESSALWPLLLLIATAQLVRGLRTGTSATLQGAGRYQQIAYTTVIAAPVTLLGTVAALYASDYSVSFILLAVLSGEIVTCGLINHQYKQMLREIKVV